MENEEVKPRYKVVDPKVLLETLYYKVMELEGRVSRLEEYLKVKGEASEIKVCSTCKWSKRSGPHVGCYYGYEWRAWIPQKFIDIFAYCETPNGEYLKKSVGAKWEKGE